MAITYAREIIPSNCEHFKANSVGQKTNLREALIYGKGAGSELAMGGRSWVPFLALRGRESFVSKN